VPDGTDAWGDVPGHGRRSPHGLRRDAAHQALAEQHLLLAVLAIGRGAEAFEGPVFRWAPG